MLKKIFFLISLGALLFFQTPALAADCNSSDNLTVYCKNPDGTCTNFVSLAVQRDVTPITGYCERFGRQLAGCTKIGDPAPTTCTAPTSQTSLGCCVYQNGVCSEVKNLAGTDCQGKGEFKANALCDAKIGCSITATAQPLQPSTPEVPFTPIEPKLQIKIPEMKKFSEIKIQGPTGERYIDIPYLAEYIIGVYNYAMGLLAMIAIVMLMIGGLRYIMARGDSGAIGRAKKMMGGAVFGLILGLGSYIILKSISPNLVQLTTLRTPYIERIPFDVNAELDPEGDPDLGSSPVVNTSGLTSILNIPGVTVTCAARGDEPACDTKCANALRQAAATMKAAGYNIVVTSCHRTLDKQQKLGSTPGGLACKCKPPGGDCSNCPHVKGVALDVFCQPDANKYQQMRTAGLACKNNPKCLHKPMAGTGYTCQDKLADAMRQAGMCKLYFEDWHFQSQKTSRCF